MALCVGWHRSWRRSRSFLVVSPRTGIATGLALSLFVARAANVFAVCDHVHVAIESVGHWLVVREDLCCTVVHPKSSTLGGATGGATLGGGTVDVTVGGVLMCLAVGADVVCMLVESACA
jgi:hypothetical protein